MKNNVRYRFGFNGKEKESDIYGESNAYDFGARIHDARIGRFLSVDPLSNKFPSESNYSYAGNNPIFLIDKNGESGEAYLTNETNLKTGRCIMKVYVNIYLYGDLATEQRQQKISNDLNTHYNRNGNYYTTTQYNSNGEKTEYDVVFEFNIQKKDLSGRNNDIKNSSIRDNFYLVTDKFYESNPDNKPESSFTQKFRVRGGGNGGVLLTNDIDNNNSTVAHEMMEGFMQDPEIHPEQDNPMHQYKQGDCISIVCPRNFEYSNGKTIDLKDREVSQSDINSMFRDNPSNGKKTFPIGGNFMKTTIK